MADLTRKQFLKLLAAAGGATALAGFLPGKWIKPIVKVGVLPVHAQSSGLTISEFSVVLYPRAGKNLKGPGLASPSEYTISDRGVCDYLDDLSEFGDTALIYLEATLDGTSNVLIDWVPLSSLGTYTGDSHTGYLTFRITMIPMYYDEEAVFTLKIKVNGRVSAPQYCNPTIHRFE